MSRRVRDGPSQRVRHLQHAAGSPDKTDTQTTHEKNGESITHTTNPRSFCVCVCVSLSVCASGVCVCFLLVLIACCWNRPPSSGEREGLTRRGSADLTPLRLVKCLHLFRLICVRQRERLPLHWAISTCVLVPPLDPTLTSHLAGARTDTNASEA